MRAAAMCMLALLCLDSRAATVEGTYDIAGTSADGTAYESRFIITRANDTAFPVMRLSWDTEPAMSGIGMFLENKLIAATGDGCTLSVFRRDPKIRTRLNGMWIRAEGGEPGGETALASAPVGDDLVGEYTVSGVYPLENGSPYGGSLSISAIDGGAQLEWTHDEDVYVGKGFFDEDGFLVSSYGPGECGVASYRLEGDRLIGSWTQGDVALKGHEIATKQPKAGSADPAAQFDLAMSYLHGKGVPKDRAKAAALFRGLAEQGMSTAQFMLGGMYMNGDGVSVDLAEATKWLELAAEQGYADAYGLVGSLYLADAASSPEDSEKARKWLLKAVDPGEVSTPLGQANKVLAAGGLGVLYYPDYPKSSYFWLSIAAVDRLSEAQIRMLKASRAQLSREEIATIDAGVIGWKAEHLDSR